MQANYGQLEDQRPELVSLRGLRAIRPSASGAPQASVLSSRFAAPADHRRRNHTGESARRPTASGAADRQVGATAGGDPESGTAEGPLLPEIGARPVVWQPRASGYKSAGQAGAPC